MTIPYPKELTLAHWKTKRSRLVAAEELERLLTTLERQHKGIDQAKLSTSGYRELKDISAFTEALSKATDLYSRTVVPHRKSLDKTAGVAKKTAERLVRAKTVPKSDINLVTAIARLCECQQSHWETPSLNGRESFAKLKVKLEAARSALKKDVQRQLGLLTQAAAATKTTPTVPFWIIGKDPRIDVKPIGDKSVEAICKRISLLIAAEPSLEKTAQLFNRFADDYPRKYKRIRPADPKLKTAAPTKYEQSMTAEQSGIMGCLNDLATGMKLLKKSLD